MVVSKAIAVAFCLPLLSASLSIRQSDANFSTQTSWIIDPSCGEYKNLLEDTHDDAIALANAVFDDCGELVTNGEASKCIDWNSQAVIEYFGPPARNRGQRDHIFETFNRATDTGRKWFSDWWYNRYVNVYCHDEYHQCGNKVAYTLNWSNLTYPAIIYCPPFFKELDSHENQTKIIKNDASGQKKLNVKNLRSRATTMLYEWLHIKNSPATVCEGGCIDEYQVLGLQKYELVRTYKAGLSKLLASRDVEKAAMNNDNYAYFAMSMWMQKNFGQYPPYPKMWDHTKSKAENEAKEKNEPGNPPDNPASSEFEDSGQGDTQTSNQPYPKQDYPDWYWPEKPTLQVTPNEDAGQCRTDASSPKLEDCYNALGSLYSSMTMTPPLAGGEGYWWPAGYNTCVIQIHYTGNWKNCNATISDVHAHGQLVLDGCADGSKGTVGGWIDFTPKNCPGTIDIMTKNGDPPKPPNQPAPPANQCPAGCDCSAGTPLCG